MADSKQLDQDTLVEDRDHHGKYRLVWFISEDGDYGAALGETIHRSIKGLHGEKYLTALAGITARGSEGCRRDKDGYYWESRRECQSALRAIKAARREAEKRPETWPAWARTALGEGWKPPKGWKP